MATLFDAVAIMQNFGVYTVLLPFILVMTLVYALLTKLKPFGESKEINAVIAVVLGLLFVSFVKASAILTSFAVFFTGFLIILLMLVLVFTFMGVEGKTMAQIITTEPAAYGTIIVIILLIFFISYGQAFPEGGLVTQAPEEAARLNITEIPSGLSPTQEAAAIVSNIAMKIILSPPVLATIIMLILFGTAAYFITREGGGGKKGHINFSFSSRKK